MKVRSRTAANLHKLGLGFLVILLVLIATCAAEAQPSPIHPTFPLLDENGVNVLTSGEPVSTMQTCGSCHDTQYIESHSFHASVGLNNFTTPGQVPGGRAWEMSPGPFGKWDPITYRYLTPKGDALFDLGTPDWIKLYGAVHVGGGPAVRSQEGTPLTDLTAPNIDPESYSYDPATGRFSAWDWKQSGVEEMNCFLCHISGPNTEARIKELQAGRFKWANTATLLGTGIVEKVGDNWQWNHDAFQADGTLLPEHVKIQDPTSDNCGSCHGVVHNQQAPLLPADVLSPNNRNTQRTGQIFSGQRLNDSGLNLAGKDSLSRSWDVHAERGVQCSQCHYSVNNPIYYEEPSNSRPSYLTFDPRRMDLGAYLDHPSHEFATGQDSQHAASSEPAASMRDCKSCHDTKTTHQWLSYKDIHMETLSCESCHIPQLHAPALEQNDWTVITPNGQAKVAYRGVEGDINDIHSLITGYEPVLLSRANSDGHYSLAPFNLVTSWYWVYGDPERPVRIEDLKAVYLDGDSYRPEIVAALDANGDGQLDNSELKLDTQDKVAVIKGRLEARGLQNPHIRGEIQPYNINHDVTHGEWATKSCETCHAKQSRITQPFQLANYMPGNIQPEFVANTNIKLDGQVYTDQSGALFYQPDTSKKGLYVPGHDHVSWLGWLGWLIFAGTLLGVMAHGGMRIYADSRHAHAHVELRKVYMYTLYERIWHWLQALAILLLLATGIIIHLPGLLGSMDFGLAVPIHNVLAFILIANAVFAIFYQLASGEIRQFLPEPRGFFRQALVQIEYYLGGIFQGKPHPLEKTPEHKLNPLQQVTYFGLLSVLLPLQILTGLLMWGAQLWPTITAKLGGLPWLAPAHTLIAWLFASFVVMHVYLSTTGHSPLADIKAMTIGWDEVEVHEQHPDSKQQQA